VAAELISLHEELQAKRRAHEFLQAVRLDLETARNLASQVQLLRRCPATCIHVSVACPYAVYSFWISWDRHAASRHVCLQVEKREREKLAIVHMERQEYELALQHPRECSALTHHLGLQPYQRWVAINVEKQRRQQASDAGAPDTARAIEAAALARGSRAGTRSAPMRGHPSASTAGPHPFLAERHTLAGGLSDGGAAAVQESDDSGSRRVTSADAMRAVGMGDTHGADGMRGQSREAYQPGARPYYDGHSLRAIPPYCCGLPCACHGVSSGV
jgi:hypothetical protein